MPTLPSPARPCSQAEGPPPAGACRCRGRGPPCGPWRGPLGAAAPRDGETGRKGTLHNSPEMRV